MTYKEWAKDYFAKFPASQDTRREYTAAKAAWDAARSVDVDDGPIKASDMTMRDHFAITYMQSCVAGNAYFETFEGVSEEAYKMADAMIQARTK